MSYHDDAYERAYYGNSDDWGPRLDDDDRQTDEGPACPFCGKPTEYSGGWFTCETCEVSWYGIEELEADAADKREYPNQ